MSESCKSKLILIRIPSWVAYGREIFRGVARCVNEMRLDWQLQSMMVETDDEIEPMDLVRGWEFDGAILFRPTEDEQRNAREFSTPVVNVSSEASPVDGCRVHVDNLAVGRDAAKHLLETGQKHFAFWGDPTRIYSEERKKGFLEAMSERSREVKVLGYPVSEISGVKWPKIEAAMLSDLQDLSLPAAVFAKDDISAAGVVRAAQKLGIKVPQDLCVLGVGDDPFLCSVTSPSLSSLNIPGAEIGYAAAASLAALMRGEDVKPQTISKVSVNQRHTTGLQLIEDALVDKIYRFILRQVPKGNLTVEDLCKEFEVSSASLLKRFRVIFGLTPKEVISKVRTDEVHHLLLETDWSIKRVALELGFRTPEELNRFFKREAGMTPLSYRNAKKE